MPLSPKVQRKYTEALVGVQTLIEMDTCHCMMVSEPVRRPASSSSAVACTTTSAESDAQYLPRTDGCHARMRHRVSNSPHELDVGCPASHRTVVLAGRSHVCGGNAYTALTSTASMVTRPRVRRRDLTVLRTWSSDSAA